MALLYRSLVDLTKFTSSSSMPFLRPCGLIASRKDVRSLAVAAPSVKVNDAGGQILPFGAIPGPSAMPFIGSSWLFFPVVGGHKVKHFDVLAENLYRDYGPVVRLKLPSYDTVFLFDADDIKLAFQSEGKYPAHPGILPLKVYRQSQEKLYRFAGITGSNGEEWYEIRSRFQRHFLHIPTVETYYPKMKELVDDFISHVRDSSGIDGEIKDILPLLQSWSIATIYYVIINDKLDIVSNNNPKTLRLKDAGIGIFEALGETVLGNQLWRIFPTKHWRKLVKNHEIFSEIALEAIKKSIRESEDSDESKSLLDSFIRSNKKKPELAVIMALDLMLAASDTTSITSTFLLYNLARNPDIQQKLYEEIQTVVGHDEIGPQHIRRMTYLRACVKETLRVNPAVVGAARILDKEVVLSNFRIPPKTILQISTMTVMRLEKYFPEAHKFIPERWLGAYPKAHTYSYLPFGHGGRSCIGKRLAQQELHLLCSEIIKNFRLECDTEHLGRITGLTNRPDRPLNLRFIPRT